MDLALDASIHHPLFMGCGSEESPCKCGKCGRIYDSAQWVCLPIVGFQTFDYGEEFETLELRNCDCGSTMARSIEEGRKVA
jgi:hypothetical protein